MRYVHDDARNIGGAVSISFFSHFCLKTRMDIALLLVKHALEKPSPNQLKLAFTFANAIEYV
jgi:hypothetical protein